MWKDRNINYNCYWYSDMQDMNATLHWCAFEHTVTDDCAQCHHFINKSAVTNMVENILRQLCSEDYIG